MVSRLCNWKRAWKKKEKCEENSRIDVTVEMTENAKTVLGLLCKSSNFEILRQTDRYIKKVAWDTNFWFCWFWCWIGTKQKLKTGRKDQRRTYIQKKISLFLTFSLDFCKTQEVRNDLSGYKRLNLEKLRKTKRERKLCADFKWEEFLHWPWNIFWAEKRRKLEFDFGGLLNLSSRRVLSLALFCMYVNKSLESKSAFLVEWSDNSTVFRTKPLCH